MAKKNPNLDNFFREKLSGYEAPGKRGNWQLLNHLLDEKKRKRRIMWKVFFVSLFLAVTFSAYLIFIPGSEKNKSIVSNDKNTGPSALTVLPSGSQEHKNKTEDSTISNSPGGNEKNISQNNIGKEKREQAEKQEISKNISGPEKSKAQPDVSGSRNKKHSSTEHGNIALAAASAADTRKEAGEKDTKLSEPAVNDKAENKDSVIIDSQIAETPEAMKDTVTSNSVTTETVTKDTLPVSSAKDSVKLKAGYPRSFSFNLYGGLNLYRTQSQTQGDQRSVSPLVGLEIVHPLSNRFAIGLGTMYSLQGGYNLADTASQVSYFLEKNVSQEIILIHKQHKLYIPVTLYYMISDKHAVSCGIHWSYLINTVGDFSETITESGNPTWRQEDNVKGYMDGINSSSFSLSVGYRLSLSKRFDINVRIVQELADSYTPQYFYGVNTAPSWSLQTFLAVKF